VDFDNDIEGHSKRLLNKIEKKGAGRALLVFVGKFESGGSYGYFSDPFRLVVDKIETIEAITKTPIHPDGPKPAWIPQNCETSNTR
jgi:hypothetical protein